MSRPGRPSRRVVYLSRDELELIEGAASGQGVSLSSFLRSAGLAAAGGGRSPGGGDSLELIARAARSLEAVERLLESLPDELVLR